MNEEYKCHLCNNDATKILSKYYAVCSLKLDIIPNEPLRWYDEDNDPICEECLENYEILYSPNKERISMKKCYTCEADECECNSECDPTDHLCCAYGYDKSRCLNCNEDITDECQCQKELA